MCPYDSRIAHFLHLLDHTKHKQSFVVWLLPSQKRDTLPVKLYQFALNDSFPEYLLLLTSNPPSMILLSYSLTVPNCSSRVIKSTINLPGPLTRGIFQQFYVFTGPVLISALYSSTTLKVNSPLS